MADYYTRQLAQQQLLLRARQQAMQQQALAARQAQIQQQMQQQGAMQQRTMSEDQARHQRWLYDYQLREQQAREAVAARQAEAARREQADRDRELAQRRGPLKAGYQWKDPQSVEQVLVPNGPEYRKLQQQHALDLSALEAVNDSTQGIIGRMGSIQSNKKGFASNFGLFPEAVTRYIPGDRYNTKVNLEQLEDMAKTSGLNQIRAGAGQSIGTITEREWPIIASQLLKLNVGQTDQGAAEMLGTARRNLLNMRNRELREYQNKWRDTPFYKEQPFQVPQMIQEGKMAGMPKNFAHGQETWDFLTPEEKALWVPGLK